MWAFLDYEFCSCTCLGIYSCFQWNHVQISRADSDMLADVQNPKINMLGLHNRKISTVNQMLHSQDVSPLGKRGG